MSCPYAVVRTNPITHKNFLSDCGKCIQCRVKNRLTWEYRLRQEIKKWHYIGSFVTATYSDDKYDVSLGLNYEHIQDYYKRLRKHGYNFKAFTTGEYGETEGRCHWHILLFGIPETEKKRLFDLWNYCYYPRFTVTPITTSRIRYTLKYMDKESFTQKSWRDTVTENCDCFAYDIHSKKFFFNKNGVTPPRSWCSVGLGKSNFIDNFQQLYKSGKWIEGCNTYKPSRYQIELLTRNDLHFGLRRSRFFEENAKVQKEIEKVGLEQFNLNNLCSAWNKEVNAIKEMHIQGTPSGSASKDKKQKSFDSLKFLYENKFIKSSENKFMLDLKRLNQISESGDLIKLTQAYDKFCVIDVGFKTWFKRVYDSCGVTAYKELFI